MKIHYLKTFGEYFKAVLSGSKPWEIRLNDRNYQVGDRIILMERMPAEDDAPPYIHSIFTGRLISAQIDYILPGGDMGVEDDYVIMSLSKISFADIKDFNFYPIQITE